MAESSHMPLSPYLRDLSLKLYEIDKKSLPEDIINALTRLEKAINKYQEELKQSPMIITKEISQAKRTVMEYYRERNLRIPTTLHKFMCH